jgi:hypothetical protein
MEISHGEPVNEETPEAAARRVLEGSWEADSESEVRSLADAIREASRLARMPASRIADAMRIARQHGYQLYAVHPADDRPGAEAGTGSEWASG